MKAILDARLYRVIDDDGSHVDLEPVDGTEADRIRVPFSASGLIIDPTDGDIEEAEWERDRQLKTVEGKRIHHVGDGRAGR